ncbi:MAG: hypothetical protein SFT68_02165 [Rickettsiaceae bacterium]|nr:hypothetical protein [Rickettsiaceae bacterium]
MVVAMSPDDNDDTENDEPRKAITQDDQEAKDAAQVRAFSKLGNRESKDA